MMMDSYFKWLKNPINFWAFLFSLVVISTALGNIPSMTPLYYILLIFNFFIILYYGLNVFLPFLIYIIFITFNILLAEPDPLFHSWQRFGIFILVLSSASPLFKNDIAVQFRKKNLEILLSMCLIIGVISFFLFFFGINFMIREETDYLENIGLFGGLTKHSMLLGPISGLGSIYGAHLAFSKNKLFWILAIPAMGSVLFAASRLAFGATIIGLSVLIIQHNKGNIRLIKIFSIIILILAISYPLWQYGFARIERKNTQNIENTGAAFNTRYIKWDHRLKEFKSSPLWGIGFCAVDRKYTWDYTLSNGSIEPGTSWLAVLSMTGIIGLCFFIWLIIEALLKTRFHNPPNSYLYLSLLAFWIVHYIAEGYIFSGGSTLCYLSWLSIGCCFDIDIDLYNENS